MIYNWHHLRQLVLPAQAQTIYKSLQLHPTGWTPETGFQAVHIWLQSVTETGASTPELPMILPRISYIYIYSCVCVYVYVCVYIQLFYTSVIPSGYGMVQCDNQWFGIPPINGHPAFQCESVTPLQQPSLMLACLVTSHSRKSASAGKRIPCSPSSRHWGGVWLAIPIQYSDSFQRETYRPIYIFILPLSFYWFWFVVEPPSKKNESHLGWRSHFHGIKNHCEHVSHIKRQLWNLGHYRRCPWSGPANEQKIPSGNLT